LHPLSGMNFVIKMVSFSHLYVKHQALEMVQIVP